MRPSEESQPEPALAVRLRVTWPLTADLDAAVESLSDLSWLGRVDDSPAGEPDIRRVAADLELPIRDGSAPGPVRKAALIDIGPPRLAGGDVVVDLSWRSATLAPLFPVFAGELRIATSGLTLNGSYAPPFGRLGVVIDAALLHFVARRTAEAFLARFARHLAGES